MQKEAGIYGLPTMQKGFSGKMPGKAFFMIQK